MRGSPEDTTEPFKTNMLRFIDHAIVEIKEQENNLAEAKKRLEATNNFIYRTWHYSYILHAQTNLILLNIPELLKPSG